MAKKWIDLPPFSNVSRISMCKHINIDMWFIDICNSQPLILCAPINSYGKNWTLIIKEIVKWRILPH
jgi:hypothetical protein